MVCVVTAHHEGPNGRGSGVARGGVGGERWGTADARRCGEKKKGSSRWLAAACGEKKKRGGVAAGREVRENIDSGSHALV
jgi:hypothetical protein